MNACDVPTKIILKRKPLTKWIKNSDAKLIAYALCHTGMATEKDIQFVCDRSKTIE